MTAPVRCPCGSGDTYADCCQRFIDGQLPAPTATALMRSRFSAFAVRDSAYLLHTWHRSSRPTDLVLDADRRWTRLDIVAAVHGGPFDTDGIVEFVAHYRDGATRGTLHERSTFTRVDGRWQYLSGELRAS